MRIPREGPWAGVLALFGGLLLVLFALVIGPWWFTRHPHHGLTAEQELKAKNDVRTTLVQALGGLAVAGGLAVTYRTYRQNRTEQDRTYKLRQAEQVNDRYTKAVEQLGHEKAPVRLGALHSLERLAQDNVELRPLVVDVLCAYLRMPYTPPMPDEPITEPAAAAAEAADTKVETASTKSDRENRERDTAQELQVRKTAQRLLADHLRPAGRDAERIERSREELFWPNTSLDLTGATLVDLNFWRVSVIQAQFNEATFHGTAMFEEATFENAWFDGATFQDARFDGATLQDARFDGATFQDDAGFFHATFQEPALFHGATFQNFAQFQGATFQDARFDEATFQAEVVFDWAAFRGQARFDGATFQAKAGFDQVTFQELAWFKEATFQGDARLQRATFQHTARFDGATFQGPAEFNEATFQEVWFNGATFQKFARFGGATFQDARFGGVTFQEPASFERATFQGPAWFDGATFQDARFGGTTFQGPAWFEGATFQGAADLDEATFQDYARFDEARVLNLDDSDIDELRVWPDGWIVRPDPADSTRGTLARENGADRPD